MQNSVKNGVLRSLLRYALLPIIGVVVLAPILLYYRSVAKETYVTVHIIASGGDWWQYLPKVPSWLSSQVYTGAVESLSNGKVVAEVLDVKEYDEGPNKLLYVKARLLVTYDKRSDLYRFRQQPLRVGSTVSIYPNSVLLAGSVISIDEKSPSSQQYKMMRVTLKLFGQRDFVDHSIHPGLQIVDRAGVVIAKVINKESKVSSSLTLSIAKDGRPIFTRNSELVDITMVVDVQTIERDGVSYFNQIQPVKIGNSLWVPFEQVSINEATISSIETIPQ